MGPLDRRRLGAAYWPSLSYFTEARVMKCEICRTPITRGDICQCCEIRASELKAIYRQRHQADIERKIKPFEVDRVPLAALGIADTWRDY